MGQFNRHEASFLGALSEKMGIDKERKKRQAEKKGLPRKDEVRSWAREKSRLETKEKLETLFTPDATPEQVAAAIAPDTTTKTWKALDKLFIKPEEGSESVQDLEEIPKPKRRFIMKPTGLEEIKN